MRIFCVEKKQRSNRIAMWLLIVLVLMLIVHTNTHTKRSKPTSKDAERFRNGLFFRSVDEVNNTLLILKLNCYEYDYTNHNSLNSLNKFAMSIQSREISLVSIESSCTTHRKYVTMEYDSSKLSESEKKLARGTHVVIFNSAELAGKYDDGCQCRCFRRILIRELKHVGRQRDDDGKNKFLIIINE